MTEIGKMIIVLALSARIGHKASVEPLREPRWMTGSSIWGQERFSHSMSDCKARSGRIDSGVCFSNWQASTFR